MLGFIANAHAEIRVLAAGGDATTGATEEIFANGDLVGSIDRPSWSVYREMTTEDIINNYDVFLIPYNTSASLYDFDWSTRVLPILASGGGVIWEAPMTTGTAGSPLFDQRGIRYTCPNGTICYIPNSPLDVLQAPGITDGITGDFTFTTGYLLNWDAQLTPFLQANATGLGTITYGLYGEVNAGRIIVTQNAQDDSGLSTGTAAQVNAYNLLVNKLQWVSSSTLPPDPNLRFVPNLDGMAEAQAVATLEALGFVVSDILYSTTDIDFAGNVISQDPQPGSGAFAGDSILLIVSDGPGPAIVAVPDVTGLAQALAESTLGDAGLSATVTTAASETVTAGNVISQNPAATTEVAAGSAVAIVVSTGPAATVIVPDVVGATQATAQTAITNLGLLVGDVSSAYSDTVAEGSIISQTPSAGTSVASGSSIDLVVSAGPEPALTIVPDVRQLSQADAEAAISALLVVGTVTFEYSPAYPVVDAGNVISSNPSGGALVYVGSTVDLVISLGPAPITTPYVVGLSLATAETDITAAGLVLGAVTYFNSDTVLAGNVISQTPLGGYPVTPGTEVDLTVSSGPALVSTPSVVGLSQSAAESAITTAGLIVGSISSVSSNSVPAGNVISQTPNGGTQVSAGSSVDLVISTGSAAVSVPDVVGLNYSTAVNRITSAGLVMGNVSTVSTRRSCGVVRSQTPTGGTSVSTGSEVDLVVTRTRFCNPL
ncbi:MAG: PASTA domain-containing protein [Gammaproteobacteria bacterium]|nr:PASTA domain-containing protein [Gammaproteobacteria bacterium]